MALTRRQFLKQTSLTAGLLPLAHYANAAPALDSMIVASEKSADGQHLHSVCGLCQAKCLINGVVQNGQLIRVEGNPKSPATAGKICARGLAAVKMLYDPDRLKYPLKRVGKRGEGKWARISWGEAIDTIFLQIEKTLSQNGPDGMALFHNGSSSRYIEELFSDLGCQHRNSASQELCKRNRDIAYSLTGQTAADGGAGIFDQARCIVLLGSHFGENVQVPVLHSFSKAKALGAKLIVVDPRLSTVASKADYHLMIRPGTDTALLLGWLKYIIESGLYNSDSVNERVADLDRLQEQLRDYRLKDIASICDIKVADIKRTAQLIASSAPDSIMYPGQFSGWYGNDVQRLRAQAILTALIGPQKYSNPESTPSQVPQIDQQENLSSKIFRRINAGDISLIGCWGQNPFHSSVNPYRVQSAFSKAQFVFTCDIYPTETSLYADIILPEATFLERSDGVETINMGEFQVVATKQSMVEPRFAVKDPYWIVKQLSSRLGKGKNFHFDSISERTQLELDHLNVSFADLKKNGFAKIAGSELIRNSKLEPSAAAPLILFSSELQERGVPPLPLFEPVKLPPSGYTRLVSGRSPVQSNSTTLNVRWLKEENPDPELWLNTHVAKKLGIADGENLFLENQDGIRSLKSIRIKVTDGIRADTVYLAHSFGCKSPFMTNAFQYGVSDSALLTRSVPDPVSGVRGIRGNFVRFVKNGQPLSIPDLDRPPEILKEYQKWWLDSFGSYESGDLRKLYV